MLVMTLLASAITDDSVLMADAPLAEDAKTCAGTVVVDEGVITAELTFANRQNLSAAMRIGSHSLQYIPAAQQFASWELQAGKREKD